jgi:hypothetical protein
VLSGLKGALAEAGTESKTDYDEIISRLGSRVFLLHNVHEDRPVVFHTRWAQSYLRGPLTRPQVSQLQAERGTASSFVAAEPVEEAPAAPAAAAPAAAAPAEAVAEAAPPNPGAHESGAADAPSGYAATPPGMDPGIDQVYLPLALDDRTAMQVFNQHVGNAEVRSVQVLYDPTVVGAATVAFVDRKADIEEATHLVMLVEPPVGRGKVDWAEAELLDISLRDLRDEAPDLASELGPFFASSPDGVRTSKDLTELRNDLSDWLYYNQRLPLREHEELEILQRPDESERDFLVRLQQAARERRDAEVDALEEKYAKKIDAIEEKKAKEERELAEDEAEFAARQQAEWVGMGESALNFFFGRRSSSYVSRAMTKRRMTAKAKVDIEESVAQIAEYEEDIQELNDELQEEIDEISEAWEKVADQVTFQELKPRRTDVQMELMALAWRPSWYIRYNDGYRDRTATIPAHRKPAG